MQVESSLPGVRALGAIPAHFRALALSSAVMLWLIVASGATVRLTASGLGCEHWPGCQPGQVFPEKGYHSFVEFSNRMVAAATICVTLVAWLGARRAPGLPRWASRLALFTFVGTLAQAPLGAITVASHLNPKIVLSHLLLSIVVLGAGVVVAIEALRLGDPREPYVPMVVRRIGLVLAAACFVLVVSGTFVTAAGPHPGSKAVRRLGSFQPAVEAHVRATAVFGIAFALLLAYLFAQRRRWPGIFNAALAVLAVLVAQMAVGEIQYRTQLPWWLVLVHVTLAAAVWAVVVAFVTLLWRPVRALRVLD
jgi:cytochrome c oxidase assembly protein subunit 15